MSCRETERVFKTFVPRDWRDERSAELEAENAELRRLVGELTARVDKLEALLRRNSSNSNECVRRTPRAEAGSREGGADAAQARRATRSQATDEGVVAPGGIKACRTRHRDHHQLRRGHLSQLWSARRLHLDLE